VNPSSLDRILNAEDRSERLAIMSLGHSPGSITDRAALHIRYETPEAAARDLYARLRAWDDSALDAILILAPPDTEEWRAIGDRVRRATGSNDLDERPIHPQEPSSETNPSSQ
jgi:L-threonylcarbamoyladenylate synthase